VKVVIITQARIGSTRFPGKVLELINGESLLSIHLNRLKKSTLAQEIIVATTFESGVDEIINIAKAAGVKSFQGSTTDVLSRFYKAGLSSVPDYIVRLTSDCPLIDSALIDTCIRLCIDNDALYLHTAETFPDGLDVEVFPFKLLEKANHEVTKAYQREHVTPWIREYARSNNRCYQFECDSLYSGVRITVDELTDFKTIEKLIQLFGDDKPWNVYADFILKNHGLFASQTIPRNEGYIRSINMENDDDR
jgi:spore coat polysaccharide biosynthesis protein SpsF (cytidylyltransferase family)